MAGLTDEFLEEFTRRGTRALPANASGTVRFDGSLDGRTEHWYLTVRDGVVTASRENQPADCVLYSDPAFFEDLLTGR
ncbi:MAG TPA: sterol-binding protein, partial [Micromonospora sp.]